MDLPGLRVQEPGLDELPAAVAYLDFKAKLGAMGFAALG
jgi:hypothetical protein